VENKGEITVHPSDTDGTLEGEDVRVEVLLAGADRPVTALYPDITLGVRGTAVLVWTVDETVRDRMQSGYTVVLDPDNAIAEGDETNNEYVVPTAARLRLMWAGGWAHFCQTGTVEVYGENIGGRNTWNLELYASVHAGGSSRVVADWSTPEVEMDWRYSGDKVCTPEPFLTDWFEVAGDETLEIIRTAGLDIAAHGYRWFSGGGESLTIEDDFGGTTHIPAGLDARCLPQALRYYYDNGPGRSYGSCTYFPAMLAACGGIGAEGVHTAYYLDARSDDITGECWWSTSYLIYREDE